MTARTRYGLYESPLRSPGTTGLLLFAAVVCAAARPATALMVTFTNVADTSTEVPGGTGNFSGFGEPAIADGSVAFKGFGSQDGIYTNAMGFLAKVADQSTPMPGSAETFASFGNHPSFDGTSVAFEGFAFGGNGENGIYTNAGGSIAVVADLTTDIPGGTGKFTSFADFPSIDGGIVAFVGTAADVEGIYSNVGGSLGVVVDENTPIPGGAGNFSGFGMGPSIDAGNVAFESAGIYVAASGSVAVVADASTPIPGGSGNFSIYFGQVPSLDAGHVAFSGYDETALQYGIYSDASGSLALVADESSAIPEGTGNFTGFGFVSLSGSRVAFLGQGASAQEGIYVEIDGVLHKVIDLSDMLDGKSLSGLAFGPEGMSGDSIAFLAHFTDSSDGIYTALIPEPSTGLLLGLGLASLAAKRRRALR
jgi:hypothetical protein